MSISAFAAKKFVRLLVPYFLFGVASWLVYDAMYHSWGAIGGQMWQLLIAQGEYKCNSVLWFLPTMFMVMFVHLMLEKVILSRIKLSVLHADRTFIHIMELSRNNWRLTGRLNVENANVSVPNVLHIYR